MASYAELGMSATFYTDDRAFINEPVEMLQLTVCHGELEFSLIYMTVPLPFLF